MFYITPVKCKRYFTNGVDKKMNVLSLFDGAACAMVCLKRAGIPIENYYSSEIKKCAIRCETLLAELLDDDAKKAGVVMGVLNTAGANFSYSDTAVGAQTLRQGTRAKEGTFVLTQNKSKTPAMGYETNKIFKAGYDAFRCPTQAELARFHTYPVEIMQQFTPPRRNR